MTTYTPTRTVRSVDLRGPRPRWTELCEISTDPTDDTLYNFTRWEDGGASLRRYTTRGGTTEIQHLDPTDPAHDLLVRLARATLDTHLGVRS